MTGITRVAQAAGTAGDLPIVEYDYANGVTRTFTSSSAQTAAINANVVRLVATQNVWYTSGANPTAAAGTSNLLPAFTVEHVKITSGHLIAALRESTDGTLYITPCVEV